jgi:putative spermidine/putrescine transport system permease protein
MPSAILNATLLSVALVLGEYTVANLLNYQNMQVEIAYVGLTSAGTSIAVAVASLLFTFLLLFLLSIVGRALSRRTRTEEILPSAASAAGIWGQRV